MKLAIALLAVFGMAHAQPPTAAAPIAGKPVVTIRGTINAVQIARGEGMPSIAVRTDAGVTNVRLGSIRYLMEQNFNPKAGLEVVVKGYKLDAEVIAISVSVPSEKREIRLRDEQGWPLWIRARNWGRRL